MLKLEDLRSHGQMTNTPSNGPLRIEHILTRSPETFDRMISSAESELELFDP